MDRCPVLVPTFRSSLQHPIDKLRPTDISKSLPRPSFVSQLKFVDVGGEEPVQGVPQVFFYRFFIRWK